MLSLLRDILAVEELDDLEQLTEVKLLLTGDNVKKLVEVMGRGLAKVVSGRRYLFGNRVNLRGSAAR